MSPKDKEILNRIYDKHYGPDSKRIGKGSKAQKEQEKVKKVIKEKAIDKVNKKIAHIGIQFMSNKESSSKEDIITATGETRNALMLKAKEKSIKNFRILNKEELIEVLSHSDINDSASKNYVNGVIQKAVARWKSGWGSKNKIVAEKVTV